MNYVSAFILLFTVATSLQAQEDDQYPSAELDKYYRSLTFPTFEPTPEKTVKSFKPEGVTIKKSPHKSNKFISVWESTDDQQAYVTLRDSCVSNANATGNMELYVDCMELIDSLESEHSVAGISIANIIKVDSETNPGVILYTDSRFEYRNNGYWIAILENNGWQHYYTGLTANHYLYVKPVSTIPFRLSNNKLQVEAALVRLTSQEVMPSGLPEYELVKDHLILEFDMSKVRQDSDGDGLTDLLEQKFGTDPNLPDTDGDGIDDLNDKVPLSIPSDSPFVDVYSYLLNNPTDSCYIRNGEYSHCGAPDTRPGYNETYLIVTYDDALKAVTSNDDRLIILTSAAYEEYKKRNPVTLDRLQVTPMFKVDNQPGTFRVNVGGSFWDDDFVVIKKEQGWLVLWIGGSII